MVFVYTARGVLCVEHANVLELCYIELLSGDGSPYSILYELTTEPSTRFGNNSLSCYEASNKISVSATCCKNGICTLKKFAKVFESTFCNIC